MTRPLLLLLLLLLPALLAGCATRPPPSRPLPALDPAWPDPVLWATQAAREAWFAGQPDWRLQGRAAFADGRESATVQIDWRQRGAAFDIRLVAPVTGRSLRLEGGPGWARLEGLAEGPREAHDAEQLLREATGWALPVAQLPAWVRGLRGDGPVAALAFDAEGRPLGWEQAGWQLEYRDWWPGDPPLPRRVFARRDTLSVRIVVSAWSLGPEQARP